MQPVELALSQRLLMIPDLLHNWLCGSLVTEYTNATTTQCWDPIARVWIYDLLDQLAIHTSMLAPVVNAGTPLGDVLPGLQSEIGKARVVAPATHDTGSAIVAIPVSHADGWGYISSGTWSLVGVELSQPIMTSEALAANCTNEGGVFGTTRFLKNVMGLWLLQECQRRWALDSLATDYDSLLAEVDDIPAFESLIDPDEPRFLAPENMPVAINMYLSEHGYAPLQTPAAFGRCIMESLVLRYCEVFQQISLLTGIAMKCIYVIGGGARNSCINQWLADALNIPVITGPTEATARGNALMQLVGLGELHSMEDVRSVARSEPTQIYSPRSGHHAVWIETAQRFSTMYARQNR